MRLVPQDIDRGRMVILVRNGKGRKDRFVPMSERTLQSLKDFWHTHKCRELLFPHNTGDGTLRLDKVQRIFKKALGESGVNKPEAVPRTLRHSFATHLVDAGIPIHVVKMVMGHKSLNTTVKYYVHLTPKMLASLSAAINRLAAKL